MTRLSTTRVVAVICSGLMAGLLFGDWLGPSFARSAMNASSFIQFQQIVHINYLRTLPALSTVAMAAPILWFIMCDRRGSAEFKILMGATIAIAIGYTITFVFKFRLTISSRRGTSLFPQRTPRDLESMEKAHIVRTIFGCSDFLSKQLLWRCRPRIETTHLTRR